MELTRPCWPSRPNCALTSPLRLAGLVIGGGVGPLDLAVVEADLLQREASPPSALPPGWSLETITSDSLYSMYFCLSPVARHNSSLTSVICVPLQQATANFGLALSRVLTIEKSWWLQRSAEAAPLLLREPALGWFSSATVEMDLDPVLVLVVGGSRRQSRRSSEMHRTPWYTLLLVK